MYHAPYVHEGEIVCTMAIMTKDEAWLLKEKYNDVSNEAFARDCARLENGEPLAYVIGWVPFLNTHIKLDSRPLIPRPETEYWTERAITEMKQREVADLHVLDLCAGSGCIGVAVLQSFETAHVDFVEIETIHHETIQNNITWNTFNPDRARIMGGDLFENVTGQYDFILTNPPYIDPSVDRTTASVREFEPHTALYGGTNGLALIERIVREAPRFLRPHGVLIIEHEPEQSEQIAHMANASKFKSETHMDQFHVQRFTRMVLY